jgi:hypothetical protein
MFQVQPFLQRVKHVIMTCYNRLAGSPWHVSQKPVLVGAAVYIVAKENSAPLTMNEVAVRAICVVCFLHRHVVLIHF